MYKSPLFPDMTIMTVIIETFFICICTYYTSYKIINKRNYLDKQTILSVLSSIVVAIICGYIKYNISNFTYNIVLVILLSFTYYLITKETFINSLIITIISFGITYIILFLAIGITFVPIEMLKINNDYISLICIMIVHIIFLNVVFRKERFKKGLMFLTNKSKEDYFEIFILNISACILFLYMFSKNANDMVFTQLMIILILFLIIMIVTIQKTLTMYYKHRNLIKDLKETKEELESKNKEIERLEQENLNFSKVSHSISHQQKSLENKLNELIMKSEIADEINIQDRIDKISNEYHTKSKVVVELDKTGIIEIDDMLRFMQIECVKNNIEFELQLSEDIQHMVNNFIPKGKLEILLADHIKDAIIAINHSENINRNILVRLGIIEGCYGLYIYDTGIEFDIDTLINLGKKPITTHADEGGTGMGFLNTFDTLKECKAGMVINEIGKPSKDNYTKVIMFKFDKQERFTVKSYRANKIKEMDINNNLEIEY